jgi:hypothetical protein
MLDKLAAARFVGTARTYHPTSYHAPARCRLPMLPFNSQFSLRRPLLFFFAKRVSCMNTTHRIHWSGATKRDRLQP